MKNYSEEVASDIDSEIRHLIEQAYQTALKLLEDNVGLLHKLAKLLLEKETIDSKEFETLYTAYAHGEEPTAEPPEELEEVKKIDEIIEETIDMEQEKERGEE